MKAGILIIFFQLFQICVYAQVRVISLQKNRHVRWASYSFPLIQSSNKTVADKINGRLQSEMLMNDEVLTDTAIVFEKSMYIQNDTLSQAGYSDIKYKVELNTKTVLSISFNLESLAAYPENYHKYYNFNNRTGEIILAKDLFTAKGLEAIKKQLLAKRKNEIVGIIRNIKADNDIGNDSLYIEETYAYCNENPSEDNFLLKTKSIVFYKEACFPHMFRVFDSDLAVEFTYKEFAGYLSENGKKLILSK